jgi:hypothetical protein
MGPSALDESKAQQFGRSKESNADAGRGFQEMAGA